MRVHNQTFPFKGAPRAVVENWMTAPARPLQQIVRRHCALNARPVLATGMPERDDFKVLASRTVVDEVAGSRQVQAPRFGIAGVFDQGADARLLNQCFECGLQVGANGSWRCKAVLAPSSSGGINLPLSPWLDTNEQRQVQSYFRSFSRSSSPEIPSSRSASSRASSSSA